MRVRCTSRTRKVKAGRHPSARHLAALFLSGLLSAVNWSAAVLAQPTPVVGTDRTASFAAHIDEASRRFRIPAAWIRAVMGAESAHDIRAVSSAGAMGLMQVMPETWLALSARYGLGTDPFDPRYNILAGTAYLREMYDRYGCVSAMLAAYNAGPHRYDEYLAGTRSLPAETRAYVDALAPLLGNGPLAAMTSAARGDPLAWMSAPPFVVRSDRAQSHNLFRPELQPDGSANAAPLHDVGAMSPRSSDLFVAQNSREGPQ